MTPKHLAVAATAVLGILAFAGIAAGSADIHSARAGTARYHNISTALAHGYGLFTDAHGIACIDNPGVGGMGIHYVKLALVLDPEENAATPEAVIYEPQENGRRLSLVAVEYVVLKSAWEGAGHTSPPTLFGQQFTLVPAGNRYGLPDFYELHVWLWKHNPRGMFDDWNPNVSCAADEAG